MKRREAKFARCPADEVGARCGSSSGDGIKERWSGLHFPSGDTSEATSLPARGVARVQRRQGVARCREKERMHRRLVVSRRVGK